MSHFFVVPHTSGSTNATECDKFFFHISRTVIIHNPQRLMSGKQCILTNNAVFVARDNKQCLLLIYPMGAVQSNAKVMSLLCPVITYSWGQNLLFFSTVLNLRVIGVAHYDCLFMPVQGFDETLGEM